MIKQPKCPTCKRKLSTGASINGKSKFFCINNTCLNKFKVINNPDEVRNEHKMNKKEIREAVARGWNHPGTENHEMDDGLAEAIVEEVWKVDKSPNLGYATTIELVEELLARTHVARVTGEEWPDYRPGDIH